MGEIDIEQAKLALEQQRLEIERSRFEAEKSFSKQYFPPVLGVLGAIVAGLFALGQVWVANIQRDREVTAAEIQKERDTEIAALERDRRWKLDLAEFVFKNRQIIFEAGQPEDRKRIFNVIAITFPANLSAVLLQDLQQALPEEQRDLIEDSQQIVALRQRMSAVETGTDRFGSDYKDFKVSGIEECSEACRTEPTCQAYSFNRSANQCWLKNAVPRRRENPAFDSGVKIEY